MLPLSKPFARRAGTVLFAVSLATTVAACGGGSSAKAASTTTSTTAAPTGGNRFSAFLTCMSSHGITLPRRPSVTPGSRPPDTGGTGTGGGGLGGGFGGGGGFGRFTQPPAGVDPTAYQNAYKACQSSLPTGGFGGGANSAAFRTAFTAYVNCLKNHGVTGIGTVDTTNPTAALANVDRTSATFKAASTACQALLPQRSPRTTTTTTGA